MSLKQFLSLHSLCVVIHLGLVMFIYTATVGAALKMHHLQHSTF